MDSKVAENINILAKFLGTRDIDALNQEELFKRYGIHQVDVMVLFGGSILEGGDVLASGNNITYLLDLLKENNISFNSIILSQDASMQRRMAAGLKKYINDNVTIINYATYCAKVLNQNDELVYEEDLHGMWPINRDVNLLMGEIPRLSDDANGYGPNGKNYIAHVDIPENVKIAFEELKMVFGSEIRAANPLYATNMNKNS